MPKPKPERKVECQDYGSSGVLCTLTERDPKTGEILFVVGGMRESEIYDW